MRVDDRLRTRRESAVRRRSVLRRPGPTAPADRLVIYDAGNEEDLPGRPARRDGAPATGDVAVDEAYEYAGQVWDLFATEFARRSVDGRGSTVGVTVHYGLNYDNAFWDGTQLVFGDGDGKIFDRFTKPMDVMAHEFTHGVIQFTAGLVYQGQSGCSERECQRRVRRDGEAADAGPDRRPGRLADRRGTVPAGGAGSGSAVDARAGYGLRRPPAGSGPAGGLDGGLSARPRRTAAGSTSTPGSPTEPSRWPRGTSADRAGRRRGGSGTTP